MEKIKIESPKGAISAVIHRPQGETAKLAILCPGFLDSKDYLGLTQLAVSLCKEGYTTVRFDPIGVWESEGDIADYLMTQYLADIKVVLEYMLSQGEYAEVLLGGHSRGAQMAILYAAGDSRISFVLGIMPSHGPITGTRRTDWERAKEKLERRDLPTDKNEIVEYLVPFTHVLDRDRYDALRDVAKVAVPIALFSGELDDIVDPESVKEIFESANEPKSFVIIPGIGHDYRHNADEVAFVNREIVKSLTLGRK